MYTRMLYMSQGLEKPTTIYQLHWK